MRQAASLLGSLGFSALLMTLGCGSADDSAAGDPPDQAAAGGAAGQIASGSAGSAAAGTSTGAGAALGGGSSGAAGKGGSSGGTAGRGGASGSNTTGPEGGVVGNPEAGPVKPLPCANVARAGVWENVTPSQVPLGANGSGVPNVVVNPLSPGELYICTNQKGIYKSSDCGASWAKVDTGRNAAALDSGTAYLFVIDPVTPNVIYADAFLGSDNNLFKTTNGGVDWDPLWKPGEAAMKAAGYPELLGIDPTNHEHLVANFHQNCNAPYSPVCFGESTDGGATWRIDNGPPQLTGWAEDASPIVVNATTFMLGAIFTPLYLTTDNGATWKQVAGSGGLRMLHENGWYYDGAAFSIQRSKDLMTWTSLDKTPGLVGFGFTSDRQSLFASSRYHIAYVRSPIADGATWTPFAGPTNLVNPDIDGSYSLAVDTSHHILYSANQGSGVYRMSTASP